MHEILVSQLNNPDEMVLGFRWINPRTRLLDRAAVKIPTRGDPSLIVAAVRQLADEIERLNRDT